MVPVYNKLFVLTWKCYKLRKKNFVLTTFEFVCPVLVTVAAFVLNWFSKGDEKHIAGAYDTFNASVNICNISTLKYLPSPTYLAYCNTFKVLGYNNFSDSVMAKVKENLNLTEDIIKLNDERQLSKWLHKKTIKSKEKEAIGVVFLEINNTNSIFTYAIRSNSYIMSTENTETMIYDKTADSYEKSAFLLVQILLERELLESTNFSCEGKSINFGKLPKKKDVFALAIYMMYLFIMLAYVFLVASVVKEIVQEKATGIKELMRILGVSNWMIWTHWLIYNLMVQLPVTVCMTLVLAVLHPRVLDTNAFVVWLLLFLFTIDCILLLFTISCLFNGPIRGTTISIVGWFVLHFSTWAFIDKPGEFDFHAQLFMCLIPLHNLCSAIYTIFSFTNRPNGLPWTFQDLFEKGFTGSQISVGLSIVIFLLKIFLWSILFSLLDAIKPGPYGVAKSLNFFYHWFVKMCKKQPLNEQFYEFKTSLSKRFESPPQNAKVGIAIRALHKEYGLFKKVVAVEHVDLDIYEGEIMALLGHNGAGKTTTMSMISGMFSPTRGSIFVDGKNINDELSHFRQSLGLCTQHNMYFPKLTVLEHLIFFGMLKGASYSEASNSSKELLTLLNISDKQNVNASKLSGGMKRRLCLAISLIGNPKVLILDEPSSGLDPENRRQIWNIILKMRGSRTVLITTHFMEEAEVLGDRVAIMDHGQVVCCGTTMFLKKIYGTGYNIHILKDPNTLPDKIYSEIQNHILKPKMTIVSPSQLDFVIKETFVEKFPELLHSLEKKRKELGITSISITYTTLEDVFLCVAERFAEGDQELDTEDSSFLESVRSRPIHFQHTIKGMSLIFQRLKTLIWKRYIYQYRNYLSSSVKILCAIILVFLMIWFSKFFPTKRASQSSLVLSLRAYSESFNIIINDNNTKSEDIANVAKEIIENEGGKVLMLPGEVDIEKCAIDLDKKNSSIYTHYTLLALKFSTPSTLIGMYQSLLKVHMPGIAVNIITNTLLRNATNNKTGNITVINYPYVLPQDENCGDTEFFRDSTPLLWMFYIFCITVILMMDFIPFITEERSCGLKHQQVIAGVSPLLYWVCNFLWDFCFYLCMIFLCYLTITIFGRETLSWKSHWTGLLTLVLVLYGLSGLIFLYIFTFLLDNHVVCSSMFLIFNMAFGLVPAFIVHLNIVHNFTLFFLIITLFSFNPTFAATISTGVIAKAIVYEQLCQVCGETYCKMRKENIWRVPTEDDRYGISIYIAYLASVWILYLIVIFLNEWNCARAFFLTFLHKQPDAFIHSVTEEDVIKETESVMALIESGNKTEPLRVEGLVKKYCCGPKAVNLVSFVVQKGECFGLLGVNGAGKTTTFKILTGEITPDCGESFVKEFSVIKNRSKYLSCIGYCPQFDALLGNLTGEETLKLIAKIRGIPNKDVVEEVNFMLSMLGIMEHANKRTVTYSGGTKRKLSTAMAFIGNPVIVFLDEPTTGVDPVSRRKLWSVVQARQQAGQAVVLTSHSMEECEALCNRVTIMRDGHMQCIGTIEHLKQKYGKGYTVLIKLDNVIENELNTLKVEFYTLFPTSIIKDEHVSLIHYQILDPNILLSTLFDKMLKIKTNFSIVEDFHISNTTLEQLFLTFAQKEEAPVKRRTIMSLIL